MSSDVVTCVTPPLCVFRADRETAARITEEIGNLMKEIENLVEEKKKDSSDMAKIIVPQESKYVYQITNDKDVDNGCAFNKKIYS